MPNDGETELRVMFVVGRGVTATSTADAESFNVGLLGVIFFGVVATCGIADDLISVCGFATRCAGGVGIFVVTFVDAPLVDGFEFDADLLELVDDFDADAPGEGRDSVCVGSF